MKRRRKNVTPSERAEVVRLKLQGKLGSNIAKVMNMDQSTVSRILSERHRIIENAKNGTIVKAVIDPKDQIIEKVKSIRPSKRGPYKKRHIVRNNSINVSKIKETINNTEVEDTSKVIENKESKFFTIYYNDVTLHFNTKRVDEIYFLENGKIKVTEK